MGTITSQVKKFGNNGSMSRGASAVSTRQQQADVELRVLLLGTAGAGKTTVFKQLQMLHKSGFTERHRLLYRHVIYFNVNQIFKELLDGCVQLGIDSSAIEPQIAEITVYLSKMEGKTQTQNLSSSHIVEVMKDLWNSSVLQQCFARRNEIRLLDSCEFFLSELNIIIRMGYSPTTDDILRAYATTIGTDEFVFPFRPGLEARLIDVGGLAIARRQWVNYANNLAAVFYVCDLSGYCRTVEDDGVEKNSLHHSLAVFKEVEESPLLKKTPFVVLLNKTDLFDTFLSSLPLSTCMPDFEGPNDPFSAEAFIRDHFLAAFSRKSAIYIHSTSAINAQGVEKMIIDTMKVVMKKMKSNQSME
uniref:Uncharacterized protein n=1 Tax=Plectus sambesii TaxID=2011161 RepID=A0A914VRK9_9BILA